MLNRLSKLIVATGAAASVSVGALMPRPASADTTSTILTAAAAIGAVVLYSNIQRKQAAANTVVGYTRNGGTVYADGRVVMPNGQTYYPNSNTNGQYGYNYPINDPNYGQYNNGQYNNGQYNNGQYNNGQLPTGNTPPTAATNNGQYANNGRWNNANQNRANDDAATAQPQPRPRPRPPLARAQPIREPGGRCGHEPARLARLRVARAPRLAGPRPRRHRGRVDGAARRFPRIARRQRRRARR